MAPLLRSWLAKLALITVAIACLLAIAFCFGRGEVAMAGTGLTIFSIVLAIVFWLDGRKKNESWPATLLDGSGRPMINVLLVGPDGRTAVPDALGIVRIPDVWIADGASLRRRDDYAEIATVGFVRKCRGRIKIEVTWVSQS